MQGVVVAVDQVPESVGKEFGREFSVGASAVLQNRSCFADLQKMQSKV